MEQPFHFELLQHHMNYTLQLKLVVESVRKWVKQVLTFKID